MTNFIKTYWTTVILIVAVVGASFFAVKWKLDIFHYKTEMAYWEGVRNVNLVLDYQHRAPTAYDLIRLRNTNIQTQEELAMFIGDNNPWKVAEEE